MFVFGRICREMGVKQRREDRPGFRVLSAWVVRLGPATAQDLLRVHPRKSSPRSFPRAAAIDARQS